jgi:hypothetical protein
LVGLLACGTANSTTTTDSATVSVIASGAITGLGTSTASGACTSLLSPELSYGTGHE